MRCPQTVDAGVYVLGALAPADRAQYERHLAGCAECRNEVAELAVLPGLLGRLDAGTAVAIDRPATKAPAALLDSVLRTAGAERGRSARRRRWQFAGAGLAAACLAVLAAVGVTVMVSKPATPPKPVVAQMRPVDADVPIVALLGYDEADGGTDIRMLCLYAQSSQYNTPWMVQLVVYPRGGGQPVPLKPWPVRPGQDAAPTHAHVSLAPNDIDRIELDRADGEKLLVYQPA
ncbi:anti-sigma factor family protein [Rugosimonospora africana]|uniref:Anti-sigma-L factor RslA n=1 Tax=Rugosimonospora africana TaxID=556532 RepID=A0A8J3VN38_9ACTN|nr:zf-HC2 domain-containing protein [Rugosimonospora africana]GIH12432.1 anti-sigma-L factor RslA [Rugosimonospora africana]